MDITLTVILVCFVVFFIAGFIDAIAGGGGLITMPVLLLLGVPAHYTLGTGKLASSLGSITALITFWKRGAVIKEVVLLRDYFLLRRSNRLCDDTSHFQ